MTHVRTLDHPRASRPWTRFDRGMGSLSIVIRSATSSDTLIPTSAARAWLKALERRSEAGPREPGTPLQEILDDMRGERG